MDRKTLGTTLGASSEASALAGAGIPAVYEAEFLKASQSLFEALWTTLEWERRGSTPRREYYVNPKGAPYAYGRGVGRRVYEAREMTAEILTIWRAVEERCGHSFEACFLNGYEDGSDHLGWHADDSPEMDPSRPIAVVSLGATREIWFKSIGAKELGASQALGSGSLLIMEPGMQASHWHRIPKSDRPCGPRVSLTFRGWLDEEAP
jgi:alkylated DNA repair dioxygenase AlkB